MHDIFFFVNSFADNYIYYNDVQMYVTQIISHIFWTGYMYSVQCMLVSLNSSTFLSRYSVNFCMLTTDVSDKFVPIYATTVYTSSTCI